MARGRLVGNEVATTADWGVCNNKQTPVLTHPLTVNRWERVYSTRRTPHLASDLNLNLKKKKAPSVGV